MFQERTARILAGVQFVSAQGILRVARKNLGNPSKPSWTLAFRGFAASPLLTPEMRCTARELVHLYSPCLLEGVGIGVGIDVSVPESGQLL